MSASIRLGAIVRLPENTAYGKYAIVVKVAPHYITVATRGVELTYYRENVEWYGTIILGKPYITYGGNRFVPCTLKTANGLSPAVDVQTREGRTGSEETRALEIRKLAFVELMKER